MEIAVVLLVLVLSVVVLAVVAFRRRPKFGRNDLVRSGDGPEVSPADAALRGGGKSAWMRPGNFGG